MCPAGNHFGLHLDFSPIFQFWIINYLSPTADFFKQVSAEKRRGTELLVKSTRGRRSALCPGVQGKKPEDMFLLSEHIKNRRWLPSSSGFRSWARWKEKEHWELISVIFPLEPKSILRWMNINTGGNSGKMRMNLLPGQI